MHRFVAARAPTSPLLQLRVMREAANLYDAALHLLEMTLQTEVRVPDGEHFGIDGAVRGMASGATFAQRLMLEGVGAALSRVTLNAIVVLGQQACTAAQMCVSLMR